MAAINNLPQEPNSEAFNGHLRDLSFEIGRGLSLPVVQAANGVAQMAASVEDNLAAFCTEFQDNLAAFRTELRDSLAAFHTELQDSRRESRATAQRLEGAMNLLLEELQEEMQDVKSSISTLDHNTRARFANGLVRVSEGVIHPLKSPITHEIVPLGDGQTLGRFELLNAAAVQHILQALGEETRGTAVEKKAYLRQFLGLGR
ncbi:hypothetical protein SAMD00023353_12400150 [Rosellinia necatrix]|uniref:Chromosome segregation protein n=1 Tax=Rosellinia necatrix TaxID=77044 RepID=A0A1W2TXL3_ROSNE|nr:hypothetical protein SAMD00023353_12400150 [Rosellinia necatrix]